MALRSRTPIRDDGPATLLDPSCPQLERTFRGHRGMVRGVSFSPTMQQLATGSDDGLVMVWNFKTSMRAYRYIGHKSAVNAVAFSPTGDVLASASTDKTVKLWIPTVQGESTTIKGHSGAVRGVSFSPDGRKILTASDDKTLKLWSVATHRFINTLSGHTSWVRTCAISPDGRLAASGADDKQLKLWDLDKRNCIATFYDHQAAVSSVAFHPDGTCIAAASHDSTIKLWDLRMNRELLQHYNAHDDQVNSLSFHVSGDWLLSTSNDATVKVWDVREGYLAYVVSAHSGGVSSGEFSPNGEFFATGGCDNMVMVWKSNFDKHERLPQQQPQTQIQHSQQTSRRGPPVDVTNLSHNTSRLTSKSHQKTSVVSEKTQKMASQPAAEVTTTERFETSSYRPPALPLEMGSGAELSDKMEQIFRQLDIISGTMQRFQERVAYLEDKSMASQPSNQQQVLADIVSRQDKSDAELQNIAGLLLESNKKNEQVISQLASTIQTMQLQMQSSKLEPKTEAPPADATGTGSIPQEVSEPRDLQEQLRLLQEEERALWGKAEPSA
eukprot:TRINITY_DN2171_c1_g1_i1.p1 TRINITY_DN2171_c1_g1~~TRINITY_DN2171_c1_g1_i1.p1  ORF type:complete len:554 (+),score=119.85 TRINITY_DN2171_c1_g1_i1:65-1726(+)